MSNQFDYACPSCGDEDSIDIEAKVSIRLCPDGTDADLSRDGSHEWDDDSPASCSCGWHGTVRQLIDLEGLTLDPNKDLESIKDPEAAAECAAILIHAYCNNPQQVDWQHVSDALEKGCKAYGLPTDYAERVYEKENEEA